MSPITRIERANSDLPIPNPHPHEHSVLISQERIQTAEKILERIQEDQKEREKTDHHRIIQNNLQLVGVASTTIVSNRYAMNEARSTSEDIRYDLQTIIKSEQFSKWQNKLFKLWTTQDPNKKNTAYIHIAAWEPIK